MAEIDLNNVRPRRIQVIFVNYPDQIERGEMDLKEDQLVNENEEEFEGNEEDYNAQSCEEMRERGTFEQSNTTECVEFTAALSKPCQRAKPSKMLVAPATE